MTSTFRNPGNIYFIIDDKELVLKSGRDFSINGLISWCNRLGKKLQNPKRKHRGIIFEDVEKYIERGMIPRRLGGYFVFKCFHVQTELEFYRVCPHDSIVLFMEDMAKYLKDDEGNMINILEKIETLTL